MPKELISYNRSLVGEFGQSLFEVIFAIGVAALVLVGITSLSAKGVRNSSFSKNNAQATKYAQEATEWLREQRDTSWSNFVSHASGNPICLGSSPPSWSGPCKITGTPFERRVTLTRDAANTNIIHAVVEVSWNDDQGFHSSRTVTTFTNWK